jgi:hypothetical protein
MGAGRTRTGAVAFAAQKSHDFTIDITIPMAVSKRLVIL